MMRLKVGQRVKLVYAMDSVDIPVETEGTIIDIVSPQEQAMSSFGEPVVLVDFGALGTCGFEACLFPCTVRPI
jgi:hypothetical protein